MKKTPRDFISGLKLDKSNLEYIASTSKINGSLLIDLEQAFKAYAKQEREDAVREALRTASDVCSEREDNRWEHSKLILSLEPEILEKLNK